LATWLITGCSSGLGRALAQAVLGTGENVIATARDVATIRDFEGEYPAQALSLALDVTNASQVGRVVAAGTERFGGIDVLVNNAGHGYRAAVEEGEDEAVAELFATNFFGCVATIKAVLPTMRRQRSGTVVNISSIAARACPPASGYYAASKAALEALTMSMRAELQPLGIVAFSVEPGGFRTDFAGRSLAGTRVVIPDYESTVGPRRKGADRTTHGSQPGDPARAAAALIEVVKAGNAPALLVLGSDARARLESELDILGNELEAWAEVTVSTDFDS
jgi:NAD(P)-dependent dehydrogenase (short-subunit alcohol dehydrogenase family)